MKNRITVEFDAPKTMTPAEALERIALETVLDEHGGTFRHDGEDIKWSMEQTGKGVDIDRRQRLAAAALMMGFDLPQELSAASRSIMAATKLCPGMTTGEMAPMGAQSRRHALEMARGLIDEMLSEPDKGDAPDDGVKVLRLFRLPVEIDQEARRIALRAGITFEDLVIRAVADMVAREGSR
jgi:hypothetical protein